jgi:hypothetical protein
LIEQRPHNDSADDNRKVRRQTAARLEFPKQSKLIVSQSGKNQFAQSVAVLRPQPNVPLGNSVVNNMQDESEKPVHKVFPSPILSFQTTL